MFDRLMTKYLDSLEQNGEFWRTRHQTCQYYLLQGSSYHLSSNKADYILKKKIWKWYLVTKNVLTYFEKKMFKWLKTTFTYLSWNNLCHRFLLMNALKSKIYMMFDNFKMNKFEGVGIIKIKGVSIICMDQI